VEVFVKDRIAILAVLALSTVSTPPASADEYYTVPRLGYIAPTARTELTQPVLDRYAKDIQTRFASAEAVSTVPIPTIRGESVAGTTACSLLQLSGYIEPHRHWHVTASTVSVDAELVVSDCNGNVFYQGTSSSSAARDPKLVPQAQLDTVQNDAATKLLADFAAYRTTHQADWTLLLRTGSFRS